MYVHILADVCTVYFHLANTFSYRVSTPPGKSWIFLKIPGFGKFWKISFVLESPGKIPLKIVYFS